MFNPQYTISNETVSKLSKIAEIKAMVERSNLFPAREAFLRRAAIIKMAHTSTSIEGNLLQEFQVKQLVEGKKILAPEDEVKEVENYLSALSKVDQIADEKKSFGIDEILSIHKSVMDGLAEKEKIGTFRKKSVYIVNVLPKGNEELAYTPPPAAQVPKLIENLLGWLKESQQIHPVIRAGLFHYQFETIHPFTDGNGRTGRLLTLLHLYQSGWDFKKVLVLEDYYNRDRKKHYESLQTGKTYLSRRNVDLTNWINYYIDGFLEEVLKVKEQILNLSVIQKIDSNINILDVDELKIIDFIVTMGKITSADVVDILRVPKRTAQSKLKHLEEIKVLQKQGAGPSTFYSLFRQSS